MAMTPGQMLRKKLLECSRLFVKDIRGGESGCTRLSALFKEIIKIYDVHLVSGLEPKSQLPKLATWQEYAYVTSWLPTGTLGYNTPALPWPETSCICLYHSQLEGNSCSCDPYGRKTQKSTPDLSNIHLFISFFCCSCTVSLAVIKMQLWVQHHVELWQSFQQIKLTGSHRAPKTNTILPTSCIPFQKLHDHKDDIPEWINQRTA